MKGAPQALDERQVQPASIESARRRQENPSVNAAHSCPVRPILSPAPASTPARGEPHSQSPPPRMQHTGPSESPGMHGGPAQSGPVPQCIQTQGRAGSVWRGCHSLPGQQPVGQTLAAARCDPAWALWTQGPRAVSRTMPPPRDPLPRELPVQSNAPALCPSQDLQHSQ